MHETNFTPASFLKTYFTLFLVFVGFQIMLLMILAGITERNTSAIIQFNQPQVYIVIAIMITSYFIANYLFKKKVTTLTGTNLHLKEKLLGHRSASIIKYTILEIPIFFSLLSYFYTGDIIYLLLASFLIIYFISLKPKIDTIADELKLVGEERLVLQKENKEIE